MTGPNRLSSKSFYQSKSEVDQSIIACITVIAYNDDSHAIATI